MTKRKKSVVLAYVSLLLCVFLCGGALLTLSSCGEESSVEKQEPSGDASAMEGYTMGGSTYCDGVMSVAFVNADHTDFILVQCKMTEAQADVFFDIDWMIDNYEQTCYAYLESIGGVTQKNLCDKIPAQETYADYVGKTIGDLEADGLCLMGLNNEEDDYLFFEYGDDYYIYKIVTVQKFESLFDVSDVELQTLTIESVTFYDFVDYTALPVETD